MATLKYQAIEVNGGGFYLAVFENGECIYFHWSTSTVGHLAGDIKALNEGAHPLKDGWEGNSEDPDAKYDDLVADDYGWEIVADNNGIYPERMGGAASEAFEIEEE